MANNNTNMSEEYKNISSSTTTGTNKTLNESDTCDTHHNSTNNRIWISNITICTIYNYNPVTNILIL